MRKRVWLVDIRGDAIFVQSDSTRQNLLLKQYLNKYFSLNKIEELVGEFLFSELQGDQ